MDQDHILVQECLAGNEEAWSTLIDRYKNLVFSIPIKYGFSPQDAADIFQAVCLSLLAELPRLREPRALPAWLIRTASHKCLRWRDHEQREAEFERHPINGGQEPPKIADEMFRDLEREQLLRETVAELSPECRRLVELLFFTPDPSSYEAIGRTLGIPTGSIGPTRMRCLGKLRQALEKKGF